MLVSYKTAQPQLLPSEHSSLSEAELNTLGFVVCSVKPDLNPGQVASWVLGEWSVREANESETAIQRQWNQDQCRVMLANTDYIIIKALEKGLVVDEATLAYRQALRGIFNEIDPWSVVWPSL